MTLVDDTKESPFLGDRNVAREGGSFGYYSFSIIVLKKDVARSFFLFLSFVFFVSKNEKRQGDSHLPAFDFANMGDNSQQTII